MYDWTVRETSKYGIRVGKTLVGNTHIPRDFVSLRDNLAGRPMIPGDILDLSTDEGMRQRDGMIDTYIKRRYINV